MQPSRIHQVIVLATAVLFYFVVLHFLHIGIDKETLFAAFDSAVETALETACRNVALC